MMLRVLLIVLFFFVVNVLQSQSIDLAKNYFDQGEYEKALTTYQGLYKEKKTSVAFNGIISSYQQLEQFNAAEVLLQEQIKKRPNVGQYYIELGRNYLLQDNVKEAQPYFESALEILKEKPYSAYGIGKAFTDYNLLDYAIRAYEFGQELNPKSNFDIQLANIYGEQGKLEKMFDSYLSLMTKNPSYQSTVYRNFSQFIKDDPQAQANITLKNAVLKRLQDSPDLLYNEILSWLYSQQKEFNKALLQEKAIFMRNQDTGLERIIQLALTAYTENDSEVAIKSLEFIINKAQLIETKLRAHQLMLEVKVGNATIKEYDKIAGEYQSLLDRFENDFETAYIQLDYADFMAFKQGEVDEAIDDLRALQKRIENRTSSYLKARIKMKLADILVLKERFNEALIYYTQVQTLVKNDELSQQARYNVAQTSYYKGDFEWALTQLDVLKSSTSQLIANDAMQLSLLIRDNSLEDSTQTALKKYAKADLLTYQNKQEDALVHLNKILADHKGERIEDEVLLKQGQIYAIRKEYNAAAENFEKIIEFFPEDILTDDALFNAAEIYELHLDNPVKAKQYYEQLIFNHADSIFFVEARKRYRRLRGDDIK
ncbi:tetratricopeptide repeat protein [Gangjinia marincola]|uniref:Tetratricopeptide repeat protein n=1 Tax=Gangjinia marincola TaxID=578463 RepID=A0ABP3XWV2_9FLAO